MALARFGVSLEEEILRALDRFVIENSFPNRSRAIRHLIEKNLLEEKWQSNELVAALLFFRGTMCRNTAAGHILPRNYSLTAVSRPFVSKISKGWLHYTAAKG